MFLDEPELSTWQRYPTPKLGDFGLAIQTSTRDPQNPSGYNNGTGTCGFRAPEQMAPGRRAASSAGQDLSQLLAHTNVFGVGAIMWSLANRELCYDAKLDARGTRRIAGEHTKKLSSDLLFLIQDCMAFRVEDRKTFAQLRRVIRSKLEAMANDGDMFEYIAAARSGQQSEEARFELLDFVYSKYQLGLALWAPT